MDSSPFKFNLAGDANPIGRGLSQRLSINAEHQLNSPGDIGKAHQFFQPAQAGHAAIGHAAAGNAAIGNAALGRAAVAPGAGLEGLTAKAIAQLQAQVSPMIQLIMRMPGHIGLMSSAFEAFANFFMPHAELIGGLDHSIITAHTEAAAVSMEHAGLGTEHIATDMHLLPHDAPILHELHLEGGETGIASATGEHGFNLSYVNEDLLFDKGSLNVAGTLDAAKPQFDGISFTDSHGEILSGPTLSSASPATHLATSSHHAVFEKALSHGGGASAQMNSALATNSTDPVSSSMSKSLPLNSTSGGMNVGSNSFGQGNLNAAPSNSNFVNAPTDAGGGSSYGASGAGSDQLGGNNQLLAMNKTGAGDMHAASSPPDAANASEYNYGNYNHAQAASGAVKGLHAKGLTLDSVKSGHTTGDAQATSVDANSHAHTADKHIASADKHAATTEKHIDHKVEAKAVDHKQIAEAIKDKAAAAKSAVSQAAKPAAHATQSTVAKAVAPKVEAVPSTDSRAVVAQAPATDASTAPAGADNAAAGAETAKPVDVTYTIKAGDNLWNIAKDNLHNATKWQDIYKMNSDVLGTNPGMIHAGTTIHLPGSEHAIASTGEATKYVVKSGDNLWNLAKHNMGDGSKWSEIYKLNHDVIGANPDLIKPGQELTFSAPAPGGEAGSLADASIAAPAGVPTEAAAAAPQQLASAPMSSSAPAEFGQPEAVGQFGSPADSQVTLAPSQQAVEQATAAPMDPVMPPQSALPQAGAANAMQPISPALQPGAAGAATLSHPTPATNAVPGPESPDRASVVSSNLLGNLQDFLGRRK
jgi:nucleoid-associated protein YgaU